MANAAMRGLVGLIALTHLIGGIMLIHYAYNFWGWFFIQFGMFWVAVFFCCA